MPSASYQAIMDDANDEGDEEEKVHYVVAMAQRFSSHGLYLPFSKPWGGSWSTYECGKDLDSASQQ